MNSFFDIFLILGLKIILIIGFVYLIKIWLKKKNNILPIIIYWILGLFFVFYQSFDMLNFILLKTYYAENSLTRDRNSIDTISSVLALILYIIIGIKYFKRKKGKK